MLRRFVVVALVALVALALLPSVAGAQQSPVYVGGTLNLVTQTHSSPAEPLGGTTLSGSVVFGVQVSRRVAVEFEPSFAGPYSWKYTYFPGPTSTVDVVARRHDSFYSFQVRTRVGVLEPVVGASYVHGRISRHATLRQGTPYFDDSGSDDGVAAVGGLDAAFKVTSHFYFVPAFRLLVRVASSPSDPLGEQTSTGPFVFRYGVGVRVTF
jgi:hypothetical protein